MSRYVGLSERHDMSFSWNIEINLNDTSARVEIPTETRFGGDWRLVATVSELAA